MQQVPVGGELSLGVVLRFVDVAFDALAGAREEIDALNVYPVPDGDTGTNMYLTMSAARDALREACAGDEDAPLGESLATFARGALLGARGNSGVILSEMLGAIARRIGRAGADETNATVMAEALQAASDAAYAAVGTPVEGTMLSVMRAAAASAVECSGRSAPGPATSSPPPPARRARRWPAPPSSSGSWPMPVSWTPAGAA
ncbi:DAK2 domain-containing protein [Nocardioides sp. dk884]|uniref:DAK2 domain-containing protein n=1 Tax=Nocardioides sp. dk884 TaxID=2662361 RepID=UPI001E4256AA|nr:DAK2 domain-containing protein [Nocardioides sp. dk884]